MFKKKVKNPNVSIYDSRGALKPMGTKLPTVCIDWYDSLFEHKRVIVKLFSVLQG